MSGARERRHHMPVNGSKHFASTLIPPHNRYRRSTEEPAAGHPVAGGHQERTASGRQSQPRRGRGVSHAALALSLAVSVRSAEKGVVPGRLKQQRQAAVEIREGGFLFPTPTWHADRAWRHCIHLDSDHAKAGTAPSANTFRTPACARWRREEEEYILDF